MDVLYKIATEGVSEVARIRAVDLLLSFHLQYTERADLFERLRKLEASV